MNKNFPVFLRCFCSAAVLSILCGCALTKHIALDTVSDALAGADKKGRVLKTKAPENSMISVLAGESDPVLMGDFFPTALKLYEIVTAQNPKHQGLALMTGSLYVMYASAFVQTPAEMLDVSQYSLQAEEQRRAKLHYLRGRSYAMRSLELRYPGITDALIGANLAEAKRRIASLQKTDVPAAYWAAAGWLGAFSVDPLDTEQLKTLSCALALLERAAELDGDYNKGAIWDALAAFYALVPAEFGGNIERARFASDRSFAASNGTLPGPYITYASAFCIPEQDVQGFRENLTKVLAIDPDADPSNRLSIVIAQKKASWLLMHEDDYFIQWD